MAVLNLFSEVQVLTSAPSGFLGNIICPRMASSKASTRFDSILLENI